MEAVSKILQIKQNNGKLSDIPEFSVNRFATNSNKYSSILDAKAFFLTHCDYDIMANIFESGFLQSLYNSEDDSKCLFMHKLSYNFLLYWTTTNFVEVTTQEESRTLLEKLLGVNKIRLLSTNTPFRIGTKTSWVTVTPLSAGHHAGSIMLLLEKSDEDGSEINFRILHTGCCRVNVRDLRLMTPLHDSVTGKPKKINKLYLDTSFCTKNVTELPSRRFVTEQLMALTQEKISKDPEFRFEVMDELVPARAPVTLCSHFFRCVFEKSREPIHVPESLGAFLRCIPNFPDLAAEDFDTGEEYPICHYHCCCGQVNDNQLCTKEEGEWACRFDVSEISLQSNFSRRGCDEALQLFADERNWKENGYQKTVYEEGTEIRVIYCHNLSLFEQARMMNYLRIAPNDVFPLYSHFGIGNAATINEMRTLLQHACTVVSAKEEPIEIEDDYPSYFYDCTGAPKYSICMNNKTTPLGSVNLNM